MEKVNHNAKVNQEQGDFARRPWQTPDVEELLVSKAENVVSGGGPDLGVYADAS